MKKEWILFGLVFSLVIPTALADVTGTLGNVWWKIMHVGSLGFLGLAEGTVVVALTRILLWILMFTVFFALIASFSGSGHSLSFLKRNHAMVVAGIIATIAAIFLPASVILATGAGWATAVALILVGGPVVGIAYLLWKIPGKDDEGNSKETKATVMLKIFLCLLLAWILTAMKYHVGRMI